MKSVSNILTKCHPVTLKRVQDHPTHFTFDNPIESHTVNLETPALLSGLDAGHFRSVSNIVTKCHSVMLKYVFKAK